MHEEATYYLNDARQYYFLIACIVSFSGAIILFASITLVSRYIRLRRDGLKNRIIPWQQKQLFAFLFDDSSQPEILLRLMDSPDYHLPIFRGSLMEQLIALHKQYSGEFAEKLEKLYEQTGLSSDSEKKLNSRRWHRRIEGLREVSEMRYTIQEKKLLALCADRHKLVRLEALLTLIRLYGLESVSRLEQTIDYLNDWMQLQILAVIQQDDDYQVPDPAYLLTSRNPSFNLLGVRIAGKYNLTTCSPFLRELGNHSNPLLAGEAAHTLETLNKL